MRCVVCPLKGLIQYIHGVVCQRLFEVPFAVGRHHGPAKEAKGRMTRTRIPYRLSRPGLGFVALAKLAHDKARAAGLGMET